MRSKRIYGVVAMFERTEDFLAATDAARRAGFTHLKTYTPLPVPGLAGARGSGGAGALWWVLAGAAIGSALGYLGIWWSGIAGVQQSLGGPPEAWPTFKPTLFGLTLVAGALGGLFALLFTERLRWLDHAVFTAQCIQLGSREGFFLCIEARDSRFDHAGAEAFLAGLQPFKVAQVHI